MKKNVLAVSFIVLVLFAAIYSIAWFIAIPKTARALTPYKWKSISLGQKKEDYQGFLGLPFTDSLLPANDLWNVRKDHYHYTLNIHYNSDSVANAYLLEYHFKNFLFNRREVIAADSIP